MGFKLGSENRDFNIPKGEGSMCFKRRSKNPPMKQSDSGVPDMYIKSAPVNRDYSEGWVETWDVANQKYRRVYTLPGSKKRERNEPYGPEQSHHVRPGNVAEDSTLSEEEQNLIQKTILKRGHFGDIPPQLLEGYKKGTPQYRDRIAEINAHHRFLVSTSGSSTPEHVARQRHKLHQNLSALNDPRSQTNFEGPDTYDEYGNPPKSLYNETPEDKAARLRKRKREWGY